MMLMIFKVWNYNLIIYKQFIKVSNTINYTHHFRSSIYTPQTRYYHFQQRYFRPHVD